MKSVLITGGTGFIGRNICLNLLRDGWDVQLTTRDVERARNQFPLPVQWIQWNGKDSLTDLIDFSKIDAVIHLMGESIASSRWTDRQKERILKSRVRSTEQIVQAIEVLPKEKRPKTFLGASAIGVYGECGDKKIDESTKFGSDFLADVCKKWESTSGRLEALGVRRCLFRIGLVLGHGGGITETLLPIFRNGVGGRLGSGKQWMSWIHMKDLVNLFSTAINDSRWSGTHNATSPEPMTNLDFTKAFAKSTRSLALAPVPKIALSFLKGEMATALLSSQRVLPTKASELGFQFRFPDIESALQDLFPFGMAYRLETHQWVKKDLKELFLFFKSEKNLEKLTPEFLNFHVLSKSTPEIQEGTFINYRLKLHGFPLKWQSKIVSWNPPYDFVDLQIKGPYKLWHHRHSFEALKGGTLMTDVVHYQLPFGILGRLAASVMVHRDVRNIFQYRFRTVEKLFGAT